MSGTFALVYPERRIVSADWVLSQGFDAKVNAAVDEHVRQHGPFPDDASGEAFAAGIAAPDLAESLDLLDDLGLVTFARESDAETCWCGCGSTQHHQEAVEDGGAAFEWRQNNGLDY